MKATDILRQEHKVIERVIAAVNKAADAFTRERNFDGDTFEKAADFFRNFTDKCHHGKEEDVLFKALEARGVPSEGGPVGVMLMEHDMGREQIRGIFANIEAAKEEDGGAQIRVVDHARRFAMILTDHIFKENNILFNMADEVLTDEEQQDLVHRFTLVEVHDMGAGTHEKYLAIANELAEKYGVPEIDAHDPVFAGGCHHHRGCHGH
ncbi:MAG: hemerythrin domain-containing protein [Planctomycetes bacterium]|nr:hemerythrin domain-containing protein [Planctomycetota bacterium]